MPQQFHLLGPLLGVAAASLAPSPALCVDTGAGLAWSWYKPGPYTSSVRSHHASWFIARILDSNRNVQRSLRKEKLEHEQENCSQWDCRDVPSSSSWKETLIACPLLTPGSKLLLGLLNKANGYKLYFITYLRDFYV